MESRDVLTKKNKKKNPSLKERDRISNLPHNILLHILSFLDMKHVVQTSVLSRKWKYVWTSLPFLNFNSDLFYTNMSFSCRSLSIIKKKRLGERFKHCVDQVLLLRDNCNCKLQSFTLTFHPDLCDNCDIQSRLYTWILCALKQDVQELYLNVTTAAEEVLRLPRYLFGCESLKILKLHNLNIKSLPSADSMSFLPSVETLILQSVKFEGISDDIFNKIFTSSPVLESLTLIRCEFDHHQIININISAPKLKHLVIENHYGPHKIEKKDYCIKICSAPNLISFRVVDCLLTDYYMENLLVLVKAEIISLEIQLSSTYIRSCTRIVRLDREMRNAYAQHAMKFLQALDKVEALTLSPWFLEVVHEAPALLEGTPIHQFCNLRCLKLTTWLSRDSVKAITYLLKISPNIETLFLDAKVGYNSAEKEDNWEAREELCKLYHLKFVELRGVKGHHNELVFLGDVLKNGMVLEKVVLHSICQSHLRRPLIKFTEQLLTLPRASSSIAILLV